MNFTQKRPFTTDLTRFKNQPLYDKNESNHDQQRS